MKLLLKRDQSKVRIGGTIKFIFQARVELTDDEAANVKKYKIGKTLLYTNEEGGYVVTVPALSGCVTHREAAVSLLADMGRDTDGY